MTANLTGAQLDRAAGVLFATACGDALGAGYEFGPPLADDAPVGLVGGGPFNWAPGEWTDDTSMAVAIAEVTATGADLRTPAAQDQIAARWSAWARQAPDIGVQTRSVLRLAGPHPTAAALTAAAAEAHHRSHGRSGGNGALMRTAPIALAYLSDPGGMAQAARSVAGITHHDPTAGEACVLWCAAIRHGVLHGSFDGLPAAVGDLPSRRQAYWRDKLTEAEAHPPAHFTNNGWVVAALQGAWSAIVHTPIPEGGLPAQHLQLALETAVRGGNDTDTVAAIAGGLLGAVWGASAVPLAWQRRVHGWPGYRARDLIRLGMLAARGGRSDSAGWPAGPTMDYTGTPGTGARGIHPHDEGVHLGGIDALGDLPDGVDAVVSLCRLGADQVPAAGVAARDHVEVWLVDSADPAANPNLDFVLHQTATAVADLRAAGRTVLVHCVAAQSRTPTIAALHAAGLGIPGAQALADLRAVLPGAEPNPTFRAALARLDPAGWSR